MLKIEKRNLYYSNLFLFIFFCINLSFAQPETKLTRNGLTESELKIACDGYKKMMETETYLLHQNKTKEFAKKMNNTLTSAPIDITNKDFFYNWLEKNISKTSFKNINEAKVFIDDMVAITEKLTEENKELFNLIKRATPEQIREIRMPLTNHRNINKI
jgi:hypothetical protein